MGRALQKSRFLPVSGGPVNKDLKAEFPSEKNAKWDHPTLRSLAERLAVPNFACRSCRPLLNPTHLKGRNEGLDLWGKASVFLPEGYNKHCAIYLYHSSARVR